MSELARKNQEDFTKMKASMYFDSAKSWIEHYNLGHSDDAIYNIIRDMAQAVKCNVEINDKVNLNACLELLQRVKNDLIGDDESALNRIGEAMKSFRWPLPPRLVGDIVATNDELSQSQKDASVAVYTFMVKSFGRCSEAGE